MAAGCASRPTVSNLIVIDTSIFIDHLRTGRHQARIDQLAGLVRLSSVVMAELWRGATKPQEQAFLRSLERNHPILTPTEKIWLESGRLLGEIRRDKGFSPDKLRDLHFDVLIALTARTYGAWVITSNRDDYELIRKYRRFDLVIWQ
jgi:predicted nucleic acid-binding protein